MDMINGLFFFLMLVASGGLLLSRDWRWSLASLAVQYLGVFWFVLTIWPFRLAVIKLLSGVIVCLALASTRENASFIASPESSWPQGHLFRLLTAGLVLLTTAAITPQVSSWLGIGGKIAILTSLFLMGMGLLQIGITSQPLRVIVGLLTLLSGFEILFAFLEPSILVAAMLFLINFGMSITGVYLLGSEHLEESS
jgi:hypothetical protein